MKAITDIAEKIFNELSDCLEESDNEKKLIIRDVIIHEFQPLVDTIQELRYYQKKYKHTKKADKEALQKAKYFTAVLDMLKNQINEDIKNPQMK